MSTALSRQSNLRKSGNSLVVTIPWEIVDELRLDNGDTVFWEIKAGTALYLNIVKLIEIAGLKKDHSRDDKEEPRTDHQSVDGLDA